MSELMTLAMEAQSLTDQAKAMQQACQSAEGKREYALAITELETAKWRLSRAASYNHAKGTE